jgi:hypothetical protein
MRLETVLRAICRTASIVRAKSLGDFSHEELDRMTASDFSIGVVGLMLVAAPVPMKKVAIPNGAEAVKATSLVPPATTARAGITAVTAEHQGATGSVDCTIGPRTNSLR